MVNMKLKHLIQAYNFNKIPTAIEKEIEQAGEKAGVISFGNRISGSYLLNNEDMIIAMKIFFNCLTQDKKTFNNQLNHSIRIITIIQKTMEILSSIPQKEINMILDKLGMFDNTFREGKQIKHLEHAYKIEVIDGLLCFSISEVETNE